MSRGKQPAFALVHVSEHALDLIADLDAAWCRFSTAADDLNGRPDLSEAGNAYAALCQRRKELHEYIEDLERRAEIKRPVQLRFD